MADSTEELDLVALEGHPGSAPVAEPAPLQRRGEVVSRDVDAGGQTLEDRDERGAVRLPAVSQRNMRRSSHASSHDERRAAPVGTARLMLVCYVGR